MTTLAICAPHPNIGTTRAPVDGAPRGHIAWIRQDVHRSVIDLLRDCSLDDLTIAMVAERSGVHQATIYRRWGSIPALVADLVEAGPAQTSPLPNTGTLDGDLRAYAVAVADSLSGILGLLMLRTAVSSLSPRQDSGPTRVLRERTEQVQDLLDRAGARGESPPAVDELFELVVAPLYFRALFGYPAGEDDARRLVDRLLTIVEGGRPLLIGHTSSGHPSPQPARSHVEKPGSAPSWPCHHPTGRNDHGPAETYAPGKALGALDRLVGTWHVTGGRRGPGHLPVGAQRLLPLPGGRPAPVRPGTRSAPAEEPGGCPGGWPCSESA